MVFCSLLLLIREHKRARCQAEIPLTALSEIVEPPLFSVLGDAGVAISVEMIAGGVSITFVVDEKDAEQAVKVLHKEYIER